MKTKVFQMRSLGGLLRDHYGRDVELLRQRPFAVLLAARSLSMMGSSFAPVALAFGVLTLPGSTASTLSAVLASEAIPLVLFMLVGGVIGDRFPRQRVMMTGELMNAVAFGALGLMLLTHHAPVLLLCLAAAITGIGMAVLFPAFTGIIPEVVPAGRLQSGNALLALGANTARIVGIAASGAAVVWLGGGIALITSALLFAGAALLLRRLRVTPASREAAGTILGELKEGWDQFRSRQWLWVVVAQFSLVVMALQAAHGVLGPVVAQADLGGAPAWSAVLLGEAVGMVVGVMVALRLRPRRPILLGVLLMFPAALPYVFLGIGAPLWTVILSMFGLGFCFEIFGVLWQTTLQREIPPTALSRVSAYDVLGSMMFGPIGLMLAGPLTLTIGAHQALLWCAGLLVATTLAALASPQVRQLQAPREDAVTVGPAAGPAAG